MKCAHDGWMNGPKPEPAEMTGPCEHAFWCPVCRLGFAIGPCEHLFSKPPLTYRIAVNPPMETR